MTFRFIVKDDSLTGEIVSPARPVVQPSLIGERNRMRQDDMSNFAGLNGPSPGKDSS